MSIKWQNNTGADQVIEYCQFPHWNQLGEHKPRNALGCVKKKIKITAESQLVMEEAELNGPYIMGICLSKGLTQIA